MKSLRRTVRNTIQGGAVASATVESYANGFATVRLVQGGARLTNISTQGIALTVGQSVLVDYAAGNLPIVRAASVVAEIETISSKLPETKSDFMSAQQLDTSFCAFRYGEPNGAIVYKATPHIMTFGPVNLYDWYYFPGSWDTGGHIDWDSHTGRNYVAIQRTGKYLLTAVFAQRMASPYTYSGYCQVRILKNGAPIAIGRHYGQAVYSLDFTVSTQALAELSQGDILQLELYQTVCEKIELEWAGSAGASQLCLTGQCVSGEGD